MPIKNINTGKAIAVATKIADSELTRAVGLMFSKPSQTALVLKFPEEKRVTLHMIFVFYPIDVLFVDRNRQVADLKENFRPFDTYTAKKKALYAIELPAGTIRESRTKRGHKIGFFSLKEKKHAKGRSITVTKAGRFTY